MAERFITALKAQKLDALVSGYTVILTGAVSPLIAQALAGRGGDGHDQSAPGPAENENPDLSARTSD